MKRLVSFLFLFVVILCICIVAYADPPTDTCSKCGSNSNWSYVIISEPTCTEEGIKGWVCTNEVDGTGCGTILTSESVAKIGHDYTGTNPRVCKNCGTHNPLAIETFDYTVATHLFIYDSPTSTTVIPSFTPATATGTIIYSVYPEGIIGLGSKDNFSATCDLSSSLAIYPISAGKATLTLQIRDIGGTNFLRNETVDIIVDWQNIPDVESIQYYPQTAFLKPDGQLKINASVLPTNANQNILWTSNNPSVATVDDTGLITAKSTGNATIVLYSVASPDIAYEVDVTVSVDPTPTPTNPPSPPPIPSDVPVSPSPVPSFTPLSTYTTYYYPGYYATGTSTYTSQIAGFTAYTRGALYTRTGYTQSGWSLDPYGTTKDYDLDAAYQSTGDMNLYPYWTVNPSTPLKLTLNYDSSLGTVYFNGKVFPTGHYWSINEGETLSFSVVPVSNYYASALKLAGRNTSIYNNAFTVSYSDMKATNQSATVSFTSIYGKPKTGDEANIALWIGLGLLSMAGAGLTAKYVYRKKHRA